MLGGASVQAPAQLVALLECRDAQTGTRVSSSRYATAYAPLGDTLATLRRLDSVSMRRDSYLHHVRLEPVFDLLRQDPRYQAWEQRTGLPPLDPSAKPP